jgi:succinoglycan biosynthesis transport protein ExoP
VLVSTLLALLLGAMAALLMDRLDNTVKGGEDAEVRLRQPLLAALPAIANPERAKTARLFLDDGHSHFAEAIRTARTGVLLSSLDVAHKVLLVTSSLPGEGKTTVAVNLALAHAQTKKTLLIDCDMRKPQVSRSLGLPPGMKGLTNLVAGTSELADGVYTVPDSRLAVLPVGDLPPNPLELLLSQRFKDMLKALSEEFEMVVLDSPPVELVSEALVLAPMATSTAFVVKAMSTPAPLVRKSLARLQRAGGTILGVVVNQLDFKAARLYHGEYGASSYSYGGYAYGGSLPDGTQRTAGEADKAA